MTKRKIELEGVALFIVTILGSLTLITIIIGMWITVIIPAMTGKQLP